jgi:hypothetical protein
MGEKEASTAGAAQAARLGGTRRDHDGWIHLSVSGAPYDRGFQHGRMLADEIRAAIDGIERLIWMDTATPFSWWAANARAMWLDKLESDAGGALDDHSGSRIVGELRGIMDGANSRRAEGQRLITIEDLLGWNGYPELFCQWFPAVQKGLRPSVPLPPQIPAPGATPPPGPASMRQAHLFNRHHCSAFVATGEWTATGGVIAAHTTWQRFANGDSYNVILSLTPPEGEGHTILMQTAPGYVASSMDFGQNAAGLIAISTSIDSGGFLPDGLPYFFRARRAGQAASTIEQWVALFRDANNGGYANSWLLAEARGGRIAAYELTAQHEELQPVLTSGAYWGCNIPISTVVRAQDTGGAGYDNILQSGSRRVRFEHLLAEHKGRIGEREARAILADHYDVYSRTEQASPRTICGHCDSDDGRYGGQPPYYPFGSLDGKVASAALSERNAFLARWGRACGTPFEAARFFHANPQYDWMRELVKDRPTRAWTEFSADGACAAT